MREGWGRIMCSFVRMEGHMVGVCVWSDCVFAHGEARLSMDLCVCV